MSWLQPQEPVFTQLFLDDIQQANRERGPKAKAFDTPFRFSDSGKCGRYLYYSASGYEGEPFDAASTLVTSIGTMLHEDVQEAIARAYSNAEFELPAQVGLSSGHTDGIIPTKQWGKVLYELKTMGGTAYKKSIGVGNKGFTDPGGPRRSAILQAALNAEAHDAETIIIGHLSLEAVSRGLAERIGLPEIQRVISEWIIPEEVWKPLATEEIIRQEDVYVHIQENSLPPRIAVDDDGKLMSLDPTNPRFWQCQYCSMRQHCLADN